MTNRQCDAMCSIGILILRLFIGLCLAAHGYSKFFGEHGVAGFAGFLESMGVPAPLLAAYVSATTELVGGLLIAIGLLTRVAAVPLAINMFVAAFTAHASSYFITNDPPGMEYALNLGVVFAAIALLGPGRYSADACLFGKCCLSEESPSSASLTSV